MKMNFTQNSPQTSMDVTDDIVTIKTRYSAKIILFLTLTCLLIFPATSFKNIPEEVFVLALIIFAAIATTYSKKIIIDSKKRILQVSHQILWIYFNKEFIASEIQDIAIKKSFAYAGGMMEVGSVVISLSIRKSIKIDSTSDFDYLKDMMTVIIDHLNPTRQ